MAGDLFLGANSLGSAIGPGAIIGENPIPFGAAILLNPVGGFGADSLTTGDLEEGVAGEMGRLSEFAVEFWFQTNSTVGSNAQIFRGPVSAAVSNAAEWEFGYMSTGKINFSAVDEGGTQRTAAGNSVLQTGNWYHVVGTAQGGNLRLYLNGVQDAATATWGSHTVMPIGSTTLPGSYDVRLTGPPSAGSVNFFFDNLATYRKGLIASRVLEHYRAGALRGFQFNSPGGRMGDVLDTVGSSAPRSIQTGTRTVIPRYMAGQAPLEELRVAVEAEDVDAALFVKADGTLKFLADGHRSSPPYNIPQATIGDAGGSEVPYEDMEINYSPSDLINEWNVTRAAYGSSTPLTQTASDATSISRYFKRSHSLSDVPVVGFDDSAALTIATRLLAKYKDPLQKVTKVDFTSVDPTATSTFLARELMDRITVNRTPPGGGSRISQDVFIQGIEISGDNSGALQMSWNVSPL